MTSTSSRRSGVLFRNTLYIASASVVWQVLALVTLPILIGAVGAEDFGMFSLAAASFGYFGVLSLPARQAVMKFTAQCAEEDTSEFNTIFNSSFVLNILAGVLVFMLLALVGLYSAELFDVAAGNESRISTLLYMYAAAALFIQPLSTYGSLLFGLQDYKPVALMEAVVAVSRVVVILLVYFLDGSIFWYAINELGMETIKALVLRKKAMRRLPGLKIRPGFIRESSLRKILSFGGWAVVYTLALLIITHASKILVGVMLPVVMVTYFHIGLMLFNLVNTAASFVKSAVLPSGASAMAAGDHVFVKKLVYSGSKASLAFLLPVCIQMLVFSEPIISVWMGPDYVDTTQPVASWLIASWLFYLPIYMLTNVYWGTKDISLLSITAIAGALVYIPVLVGLVRLNGLSGAGQATMFYFLTQLPLQLLIISERLGLQPGSFLVRVCGPAYLSSLLFGVIVWLMLQYMGSPAGLLLLVMSLGLAVSASIALNFALVSRGEGAFLVKKFRELLSGRSAA